MKLWNRHERVIQATPERLADLVSDFTAIWPAELAPPPQPAGDHLYAVPPMLWMEIERTGAARAFRVVSPEELQAEHWFEVRPVAGGTLLRHTIAGEAIGAFEALWRDRIELAHDRILEALLDNVEAAASGSA